MMRQCNQLGQNKNRKKCTVYHYSYIFLYFYNGKKPSNIKLWLDLELFMNCLETSGKKRF